jgi:hypothetical protein
MVIAMEMAGLLWWNNGNNLQFSEFQITKTFKNVHRTLKETGSFRQTNAEHGQLYGDDDVLAVMQQSTNTSI